MFRRSCDVRWVGLGLNALVGLLFIVMLTMSACVKVGAGGSRGEGADRAPANRETQRELNVSAAASLKDVLHKVAVDFEVREGATIIYNFASSGDLQVQIEQGAPADVFISAGSKQMDALQERGRIIEGSRRDLLGNELVVAVSQTSGIVPSDLNDLASSDRVRTIAIGVPDTVPAGMYAREALENAGVYDEVGDRLVHAKDVRQVMTYLETGNADAGFVYASDVRISKGCTIAFEVPAAYHKPIVYPAAQVVGGGEQELAARFIKYLASDETLPLFEAYGFKRPAKTKE